MLKRQNLLLSHKPMVENIPSLLSNFHQIAMYAQRVVVTPKPPAVGLYYVTFFRTKAFVIGR